MRDVSFYKYVPVFRKVSRQNRARDRQTRKCTFKGGRRCSVAWTLVASAPRALGQKSRRRLREARNNALQINALTDFELNHPKTTYTCPIATLLTCCIRLLNSWRGSVAPQEYKRLSWMVHSASLPIRTSSRDDPSRHPHVCEKLVALERTIHNICRLW